MLVSVEGRLECWVKSNTEKEKGKRKCLCILEVKCNDCNDFHVAKGSKKKINGCEYRFR